ncbi:hypothetical protein ElyMa_001280300 [Elysia marginata]|uniref:Uncharacterized protein n=1 Tax=Elysia marginata TaxID=1093978 RepID=A0AAV4IIV2_9GAST|nr:hypothetical protein ElyMa_001280300 [Elysia marginata]
MVRRSDVGREVESLSHRLGNSTPPTVNQQNNLSRRLFTDEGRGLGSVLCMLYPRHGVPETRCTRDTVPETRCPTANPAMGL